MPGFTKNKSAKSDSRDPNKFKGSCFVCFKTLRIDVDEIYRCKGCKYVMYCGRECQRLDWTVNNHRETCGVLNKERVQSETQCQSFMERLASRYPGESEKQLHEREVNLVLEWYQLHAISLQKAAIAVVLDNIHHLPEFPDLTTWTLGILLRPRMIPGSDIDARTAFCVDIARLTQATNIQQQWALNLGLDDGESSWLDQWQHWAVENDATRKLIAAIPVTIMFHKCEKKISVPIFEPSQAAQAVLGLRVLDPVDHLRRWIPTLKAMVLRGHMLGPPSARPDDDVNIRVGKAQKLGTEWAWVPLTDEEMEQAGYLRFPGVVGSITQVSV